MFRFSSLSLHSRIPAIAALLLFAMVSALTALNYYQGHAVDWVTHSVRVETLISRVLSLAQDVESGARGYLITGRDAQLEHYNRGKVEIVPALAELKHLTIDNPEQQRAHANLVLSIETRFNRLMSLVEARKTASLDAVLSDAEIGAGTITMDSIRARISEMRKVEEKLYTSRVTREEGLTTIAFMVSIVVLLGVTASMAGWIFYTRREARNLLVTTADREANERQIRQMQKIEAVSQLTGGLAHDLNNMLAVVVSGISLAQRRLAAGDTDVNRFIDGAAQGAHRAAKMTSQLMAFSRQQPLAPMKVDANALVIGMTDIVQRSLGSSVQTQVVLNAGLWSAKADVGQLENAILNLVINARDAMPEGGKLTIETANFQVDEAYARQNNMRAGQYVQIAVTDTGVGMDAATITMVFDPYFTTKGIGKGTGLGLSQVYGFTKQSGGHVNIYSEPGQGTTVKLYLPRLHDVGDEQQAQTAKAEAWPDLKKDNSKHVVLVVEDDALVNELTVGSLRELGYTVIHANGAMKALELLDSHPGTAVLFTDIVMPDVNGRQLAAEALRRQPNIKVLYTTGFTRNAIVHSGKLDEGLHFIAKPFTVVQVGAKLTEVLADAKAA
jgi:signal transduction histidine kinase/ActR/RegA family two-component response regulator